MPRRLLPASLVLAALLATGCSEPRNNVDTVKLNQEMEDKYIKLDPYGPDAPFLVFKKEPVLSQGNGCIYITDEPRPYIMTAREFREWSGTAVSAERAQRILAEAELQKQLFSDINEHLSSLADALDSNSKARATAATAEAQAVAVKEDHAAVALERDRLQEKTSTQAAALDQESQARRIAEADSQRNRDERQRAQEQSTEAIQQATQVRVEAEKKIAQAAKEHDQLTVRIATLGAQIQLLLADRVESTKRLTEAQAENQRLLAARDELAAKTSAAPSSDATAKQLTEANRQVAESNDLCRRLVDDNKHLSAQLRETLDQMSAAQRILDNTVSSTDKAAIITSVQAQVTATVAQIKALPEGSPERTVYTEDLRIYCGILTRQGVQPLPADAAALLQQAP